jgi:hypothetical protein
MARPIRIVIGLALAAYLALSAYLLWRSVVLQPYSDMFEWVAAYYRFKDGGDGLLDYLLQPHVSHRIAWARAALALDIKLFGGQGVLLPVTGALCLVAVAAICAREASRAAGRDLAMAATALAAMLALMAGDLLDAAIHINTPYLHTLVFAMLALGLAEPEQPGRGDWIRRAGALVCLALGSLGTAAALAAWPVMLWGAARNRAWPWLAVLALAGGALVGLYLAGMPPQVAGGWSLERLIQAALLALNLLGLPWTRAVPSLGWAVGAVMFVLGAAGLIFRGGRSTSRAERLATRFILFSLGVALMAGLSRTDDSAPSDVPLRYAAFLIPLHLGLLMLALPLLARLRVRHLQLVDGLLAAGAVLFVGHQLMMGLAAVRTTDANRALIAEFRKGQRTPAMIPTVHTDLDHARALSERMARDGLFQRELHLPRS